MSYDSKPEEIMSTQMEAFARTISVEHARDLCGMYAKNPSTALYGILHQSSEKVYWKRSEDGTILIDRYTLEDYVYERVLFEDEEFLNIFEVGKRLGIPVQQVYPLLENGELPSYRTRYGPRGGFWKVLDVDLDDYILAQGTPTGEPADELSS